ncbi:MAG: response regulator [Planctomycetaceae bacterium]
MSDVLDSASDGRRLRIAVADDEYELRQYFARVLPHLGYEVVILVADGEELVRLSQKSRPDLVITDVILPGMSGTVAVSVIRRWHPVAAVFVTENAFEDSAASSAERCVALAKPFAMSELPHAIDRAMLLRSELERHVRFLRDWDI